jgi:magnesium-transporting ATPase (P-type)
MQDVPEVTRQFDVHAELGLSSTEANRRLALDGPNELKTRPPRPAWRHFLAQFQHPLVYLLLVAVVITLTVWGLEGWVGWRLGSGTFASRWPVPCCGSANCEKFGYVSRIRRNPEPV